MTDDEIAERIVKRIAGWYGYQGLVSYMDGAEAYRLAFINDVRERAKVRRQARRVRAKVFAALGVADRKAVEK
jgi:hypothetical protein